MINPPTQQTMQRDYVFALYKAGRLVEVPQLGKTLKPTPDELIAHFARVRGVTFAEIMGHKRDRSISWPRQECYKMLREKTALSFPAIGRLFNRDSSTVQFGIRAATKRAAQ